MRRQHPLPIHARALRSRDTKRHGRRRRDPPVDGAGSVGETDNQVVLEGDSPGVAERGESGFVPGDDRGVFGRGGFDASVCDGHFELGSVLVWWWWMLLL